MAQTRMVYTLTPNPSPKMGEGLRRLVRNGDFSFESCAFGQVSSASKPQAGANPQLLDKPYRLQNSRKWGKIQVDKRMGTEAERQESNDAEKNHY